MGNGVLIYGLIYGRTLTWEQVCDLVKKHIENPEVFDSIEIKQKLIQWRLWMEEDEKKREWDFETKKYVREAAKIVAGSPRVEMRKQLEAIINKYFTEDAFAPEKPEDSEHECCAYLQMSRFHKITGIILGLSCCSHGSCCYVDRDTPFVVGYICEGILSRGEPSSEITMPTDEQKKNVEQVLSLIAEKAVFLIIMDDCDSCT